MTRNSSRLDILAGKLTNRYGPEDPIVREILGAVLEKSRPIPMEKPFRCLGIRSFTPRRIERMIHLSRQK